MAGNAVEYHFVLFGYPFNEFTFLFLICDLSAAYNLKQNDSKTIYITLITHMVSATIPVNIFKQNLINCLCSQQVIEYVNHEQNI